MSGEDSWIEQMQLQDGEKKDPTHYDNRDAVGALHYDNRGQDRSEPLTGAQAKTISYVIYGVFGLAGLLLLAWFAKAWRSRRRRPIPYTNEMQANMRRYGRHVYK